MTGSNDTLRISHYDWSGGREAMLRFGPDDGPVVIATLPLFEEANRTRTFVVTILRALAERGVASVLPDVPGQGESATPLEAVSLLQMSEAIEAVRETIGAEGRRTYGAGIRSGCLLDGLALHFGRWNLAPQTGAQVLRELHRQWLTADGRRSGDAITMAYGGDGPTEVAGNLIGSSMFACLQVYVPFDQEGLPRRVVRLASDAQTADRKIDAAPLWRRAEPGNDPVLAAVLADDIADWVASCEA